MAEQITLTNLVNLQNETTAVNAINANNATITDAFLDVLSLSGTAPNQMQSNLDMNGFSILNQGSGSISTNVKSFGAKGDGVTDDTAAMQAAHNTGALIYYPAGTYLFSTITIAAGGIYGDGLGQTVLKTNTLSTENAITFTGTFSTVLNLTPIPLFEKFTLIASISKTGGVGLLVQNPTPTSTESSWLTLRDLLVQAFPTCVSMVSSSGWTMDNCKFRNYNVAGVTINNEHNADSGDNRISNCLFNTSFSTGTTTGILHISGGGLYIVNTKFNGGNYGYWMNYNGGTNSGDLTMSNLSMENMLTEGIYFSRQGGNAFTFGSITIGNSEITGPNCIVTDTSGAFYNLVITGNVLEMLGGTGFTGIILNTVNGLVVSNNVFTSNLTGGTAVSQTGCTNGRITSNSYQSFTTNVSGTGTSVITDSLVTVANLPTAASTKGVRCFVTDATQAVTAGIGAVVVGSGSNTVPVYSDGTNWRIG